MTRSAVPALALALALVAARGETQTAPAMAAGRVVTDTVRSQALGARKEMRVYLPPSYATSTTRRFPVVYYLHGHDGSERNWVEAGRLDVVMDSLIRLGGREMIVVMPDGDDSWYTTWNAMNNTADCPRDSTRTEPAATFCVPWPHYDDYIAHDVVGYVDGKYRTLANRARRGIAGLSMGGYGAITLALRYPDVFAAAASHSGVLATAYLPADSVPVRGPDSTRLDELRRWYGPHLWKSLALAMGRDTTGWWAREPRRMAARAVARKRQLPAMHIDVGVDDKFLLQNRALHATLQRLGIAHSYAEFPGAHSWEYWRAHLPESLTWLSTIVAR